MTNDKPWGSLLFILMHIGTFLVVAQPGPEKQPLHLHLARYDIPAVEMLQRYLAIPSESGNEGKAGAFFYQQCAEAGLHMQLFSKADNQYNFAASLFPLSDSLPNVVLMHHLDVVAPGDSSDWTFPPYSGKLYKGSIYGRGAIDSKGVGIMHLFALQRFKELYENHVLQSPHNITLLVVSGEEVGGANGAKFVLDNFEEVLNPAVIFGEGGGNMDSILMRQPTTTIGGISVTEKTQLLVEIEVKTKGSYGHGASPSGNYANKILLEMLNEIIQVDEEIVFTHSNKRMLRELGNLEGGFRGFLYSKAHWPLLCGFTKRILKKDEVLSAFFSNSVKVTAISNPEVSGNQLPTSATARLDIRLLPEERPDKFLQRLQSKLPKSATLIVLEQTPTAPETPITPYFHHLADALSQQFGNLHAVPILFPATSDNSHFRKKGILVYGFFPAKMDVNCVKSVHNTNERLPVSTLLEGISVCFKLICNITQPSEEQVTAFEN